MMIQLHLKRLHRNLKASRPHRLPHHHVTKVAKTVAVKSLKRAKIAKTATKMMPRKTMTKSDDTSKASLIRFQPKRMPSLVMRWIKKKLTVQLRKKYGHGSTRKLSSILVNLNRRWLTLSAQKFWPAAHLREF